MRPSRYRTRCLFCGDRFEGYGERGVCPSCQGRYPRQIPRHRLSDDPDSALGPGYVIRSDGALRYDLSYTAVQRHDAPPRYMIPTHDPFASARTTNPKRTRQEKLDSLHKRLVQAFPTGRVPDSILRDVREAQIAKGMEPLTMSQLRQLAGFYLDRASVGV